MNVVVADDFDLKQLERLRELGCSVAYVPAASGEALVTVLRNTAARALVVRSTRVSEEIIRGSDLKLIVRAGSGIDTIDVPAATEHGMWVANCPGRNAAAVAELTWGLILSLDRRLPDNVELLRRGAWNKKEFSQARGLRGRTLGLLGYGAIGREVALRGVAFGMRVIVWSRSLAMGTALSPGIEVAERPDEVAEAADVLSVHLALTDATRNFVGAALLEALQPPDIFINTARAELVDRQALEAAAARGVRIGLDVFWNEPAASGDTFGEPLARFPTVYGTHHIGASTQEAQEAVCAEAVRIVEEFYRHGRIEGAVNRVSFETQGPTIA